MPEPMVPLAAVLALLDDEHTAELMARTEYEADGLSGWESDCPYRTEAVASMTAALAALRPHVEALAAES